MNYPHADELCNTSLVIWDETLMTHRHNLEALYGTFRDMMRSTLPFGGTIALCLGDSRHILPIVRAINGSQIVNACCKRSVLFCCSKPFYLKPDMWLKAIY